MAARNVLRQNPGTWVPLGVTPGPTCGVPMWPVVVKIIQCQDQMGQNRNRTGAEIEELFLLHHPGGARSRRYSSASRKSFAE